MAHPILYPFLAAAVFALVFSICFRRLVYRQVVTEYQKGLLYRNGVFVKVLEPGSYWLFRSIYTVTPIDARKATVTIAGQEIITADNIGLKVSLLLSYKIVDAARAIHSSQSWYSELYALAQIAARDELASLKVDELLEKKGGLGDKLLEAVKPKVAELGIEVSQLQIKDLIFPADLRKAYGDLVRAQKEGLAALERARGEQAALRSLANAAKMLEGNPALMNLRILQTLSAQAGSPPPTVVLGVPNGLVTLPAGGSSPKVEPSG